MPPINSVQKTTAVSSMPFVGVGTNMHDMLASILSQGKITQEELNQAKVIAVNQNKTIEQVLLSQGKINEDDVYRAKAASMGYKFVDVANIDIPIDVLNKISKDVAQKNLAVPFGEQNGKIQVAVSDPGDLQKLKILQIVSGKPLEIFVSSPAQIQTVIDRQYGARISTEVEEALENITDIVDVSGSAISAESVSEENIGSAPVSRIVNMILEYAAKYDASDIHIEPREANVVVRFRISGILVEKLTLPKKLASPVVARIKIMSNLKIDEHRLPQDGRYQIKFNATIFDVRVSVMPTVYGEKVVMRLLATGGGHMSLEAAGLRGYALKAYKESLSKTEGIILVTGPTGSGKTHTLASSINIVNQPSVNIQTLEDPVEIRIPGITQVQVNSDIGLTFASGLRSFLRQDPDIIMVGEVRDGETAQLAVQAALTGHLVLATLHTNSATGSIPRLLDMGVESFLLSSTINVVLAQRLARRLCQHCRKAYYASPDEVAKLKQVLDGLRGFDVYNYPPRRDTNGQIINTGVQNDKVVLYQAEGCSKCNGTGYTGRIGIFEVMIMSEKIAQMIMEHRSAFELEKQAISDGMLTLAQDGFLKALEGVTTLPEVLRVIN